MAYNNSSTAVLAVSILGRNYVEPPRLHTGSLSSPLKFVSSQTQSSTLIEDDVLFASSMDTCDDALTWQDAEQLYTYLTAPYLRIPLICAFLNEHRLAALFQPRIQRLLERVLFEPLDFLDERTVLKDVDTVSRSLVTAPLQDDERLLLGTQMGLLFNELQRAPAATLEPLLSTAHRIASMCINDYTSTFVGLLLFITRLFVRVEALMVAILDDHENRCVWSALLLVSFCFHVSVVGFAWVCVGLPGPLGMCGLRVTLGWRWHAVCGAVCGAVGGVV